MRIFTDIASHDTTGVAPGGRIIRTDSSPADGELTPVNGKFVFPVPEGAALSVTESSFYFPQENANSISSQTGAEFLIRYPMYDHLLYNFYLDNDDVSSIQTSVFATLPDAPNTTPSITLSTSLGKPSTPRCQLGRSSGPGAVGMVPNSLGILPAAQKRSNPVYGCILTTTIDLWPYNPCYIEVNDPVTLIDGNVVSLAGFPLTARAGAPGVDEFQIDGASADNTATNIANAINDGANSFSGFVTATVDPTVPNRVQLRPVPATNTTVTVSSAAGGFTIVESHPGTDEVMMWWEVVKMSTTEDQGFAGTGSAAGTNNPAIKNLEEIDEETPDLLVYASVDDGATWFKTPYLEPVDLVNAGTQLRLCFINIGSDRLYLHGFCVLFPDLLAPL